MVKTAFVLFDPYLDQEQEGEDGEAGQREHIVEPADKKITMIDFAICGFLESCSIKDYFKYLAL